MSFNIGTGKRNEIDFVVGFNFGKMANRTESAAQAMKYGLVEDSR